MANTLTALKPTELIGAKAIELLRRDAPLLNLVTVETRQQVEIEGGDTVRIPIRPAAYTPTNVGYSSAATPQNITYSTKSLTFGNHKEVKLGLTELEGRTSQGGVKRIINDNLPSVVDGLVAEIESSIAALHASAANDIGTQGTAISDTVILQGRQLLREANVPADSMLSLVVSPRGYSGLLGTDKFSLVNESGQSDAARMGKLPALYKIQVAESNNLDSVDGTASTNHGLLFHKSGIIIGFMEFAPYTEGAMVNNVEEFIAKDNGVSLRVQKYYDPALRTWYFQMDVKWGVTFSVSNRLIDVLH